MELPEKSSSSVFRVTTRSSTRRESSRSKSGRRKGRKQKSSRESSPDSDNLPVQIPEDTITSEKGVEEDRLAIDISSEVRGSLGQLDGSGERYPGPVERTVTFDDTPVVINPGLKVDEYDIVQDINQQLAKVTFGQLLHDNTNYQKLIREAWTPKRRRRLKLPSVAVNYTGAEDKGAPEVEVEIEGCVITKVPVDGGSGVNLMLEDTAFELGYTDFEATNQVLRMADQSRVIPVGRLSLVPTRISKYTYLLNFVIIRVSAGRPFPILLGRPWLYLARVVVDWGTKEFIIGKPAIRIPWTAVLHLGETDASDGYTSDWTEEDDSDEIYSYFVNPFDDVQETELGFPYPVEEQEDDDGKPEPDPVPHIEDRSLGEANVLLTSKWIKQQISQGNLPAVSLNTDESDRNWSELRLDPDEAGPEKIKSVANPNDYEAVEIEKGHTFYFGKSMTKEERADYVRTLREFQDVFAWAPSDLRGISSGLGQHRIDLVDGATPVRQRQYRLNPKYSLMVKDEIDKLMEAGFIYPVDNSEWVSPIVVVPKKVGADGKVKIRVCQDFRKLNAATKKDHFPLPFTDIILDHVSGQEYYSFLDGFSGYNQVMIRKEDQLKTTFTTEWGTYAFNRMPFGLCNAPGTFQRLMMDIFKDFLRHFLEVFIDDFAVFSKRADHLEFLTRTFRRCRETGLKLHPGKCFFGMVSGLLLGHVVSREGIEVDIDKVRAILALVAPTNVREIRGFLGCVGYYRRFIADYARMATPLTELLKKKEEYVWTDRRQEAFELLKAALSKPPVLSPPNWDHKFHVTLDASGWCVGAVLWQEGGEKREHPIYYSSRQMGPAERKYTTTEREALAVVYACKKFRHYLLGYHVVFHTDHDSLKYLVNKPDLSGRIARWILLLQEFDYEVKVKPGKANTNADYLSRQRGPEAVSDLTAEFPDEFLDEEMDVRRLQPEKESEFQPVLDYLTTGQYPKGLNREEKSVFLHQMAPFTLIKSVLFKMGADEVLRRCVEEGDRRKVMRGLHSGPSGGHLAAISTIGRIRLAGYWWPSMIRDVKKFVQSCDQCQRTGTPAFRHHWPLTPVIPVAPFEKWGIDFLGPINPVTVRKKRYIILATDYATKWVEARATRKNDANTAAEFLFEDIMMRFGDPLELVSDRGKHFLNDVIEDITTKYLIKHRKTTPYNPKANGLTERANGIVGKMLNKMVSAHKTDWDRKLASAVHAYNTVEKKTTGKSPYFLVFGQEVLHGIEMEVETFRILATRSGQETMNPDTRLLAIEDLEEARRDALDQTIKVQLERKFDHDDRIPKDHHIRIGGMVLLYDNRHLNFPGKLHTRWMGPYKVQQIFDNGSLQLADLSGTLLESRVNGARVKKYNPEEVSDDSSDSG